MPQDHYVAETYLKHFIGNNGFLRAYRKRDLIDFPCRPRNICRQFNGDIIPDFLSDPGMLGAYRGSFEPHWNAAVSALQDNDATPDVKMAIAGYAANMLVCTPAMTRVFIDGYSNNIAATARCYNAIKADERLDRAIDALDAGRITIKTDPNYVRAAMASKLIAYAWQLYNAEWIVIKNDTTVDFITSDNPVAFDDPGPFRGGAPRLPRVLPITPRLCLYVNMEAKLSKDEPDFNHAPLGSIRFATTIPQRIELINLAVARCAEEIVISSHQDDRLARLVADNAPYRVANEFITIRQPCGFLLGTRLRVWDPSVNNPQWQFPPAA